MKGCANANRQRNGHHPRLLNPRLMTPPSSTPRHSGCCARRCDFSTTAIELHGKASSTDAQQQWALDSVRKPVVDEARADRIYAEVREVAGTYVMAD